MALAPDDESQIRTAAESALRHSFERLRHERVIPRSRHRPWIRIGRDYFGPSVEEKNGALAEILEHVFPERFTKFIETPDHPWGYAHALVEAAVAAATRAEEEYSVSSPSVQATIDELIEKLTTTPGSTVLQLVTDVDVEHRPLDERFFDQLGESIEVGGVRVIRVENEPERFMEQEIPSAGFEVERDQVVPFPGPTSLLVASVKSMGTSASRTSEARRRLTHFLTAVRLATGSTTHAVIDIAGEPEKVSWMSPNITPLPSWGFRFMNRPVTLTASNVDGLARLSSLVTTWEEDEWAPIVLAVGRLNRSLDGRTPNLSDQVVDLAIGLEAALAGTDTNEISLRLRSRVAALLSSDSDSSDEIYRDVRILYDLRSTIVHGGALSTKVVSKSIGRVAARSAGTVPLEEYLLALDRWRDLLRRAILARVALVTANPPWEISKSRVDVDQLLLREGARNDWANHIAEFWEDFGLPTAPRPAPPPLTLVDRYRPAGQ